MKLPTLMILGILVTTLAARADDGGAAPNAFAKTLASGKNARLLKNVSLSYAQGVHQNTQVVWTKACSASAPLRIEGSYPEVLVSVPNIDCGDQRPLELGYFQHLASQLRYTSTYIPAFPDEPNQFHLVLESPLSSPAFRWSQVGSLNALTKDHLVFLDLQGETQEDPGNFGDRSYHYLAITIQENPATKALTLRATYDFDRFSMGGDRSVELKLQADLTR